MPVWKVLLLSWFVSFYHLHTCPLDFSYLCLAINSCIAFEVSLRLSLLWFPHVYEECLHRYSWSILLAIKFCSPINGDKKGKSWMACCPSLVSSRNCNNQTCKGIPWLRSRFIINQWKVSPSPSLQGSWGVLVWLTELLFHESHNWTKIHPICIFKHSLVKSQLLSCH